MFEHRSQPLLPRRRFVGRALQFAGAALALIVVSLLIGMAGYGYFAGCSPTEAFYNSSMILTGMGPALDVTREEYTGTRASIEVFAGFYALYSGVVFLAASGLVLSPLIHRFFHKLHLDVKD